MSIDIIIFDPSIDNTKKLVSLFEGHHYIQAHGRNQLEDQYQCIDDNDTSIVIINASFFKQHDKRFYELLQQCHAKKVFTVFYAKHEEMLDLDEDIFEFIDDIIFKPIKKDF